MRNYDTQYEKYSYWKHNESNKIYRIIFVTNIEATKKNFVLTIVYEDEHHKLWSRPATERDVKMTRLSFPSKKEKGFYD